MMTAAWEKHLASRVKVSPWTTTRASGIGDPCERRIFYRRTEGVREKPYDPDLQAIFDLGNHLEVYVVRKIEAMGFDVVQRGKDWADPDLEITGHVDALVSREGWPRAVPTEIKGLNPFTAGTIERIEDIRDHASFWVRKYYDQLQTYLDFEKKPLGLFALLDKSAGQIRFIDCPRDDARIAALKAKAARIRDAVRARAVPDRTSATGECERCGFRHLCCPDIDYGDGPVVLDNPELADLLSRRAAIEATGREFARLDKKVKELLPDAPTVLVGDFEVTARKQDRASYVVPAGTSWVRKIGRIGGTH
jgi:hypothetical protein